MSGVKGHSINAVRAEALKPITMAEYERRKADEAAKVEQPSTKKSYYKRMSSKRKFER